MFGDPATNPKGWPIERTRSDGSLDRSAFLGTALGTRRNRWEDRIRVLTGDIANSGGYVRAATPRTQAGLRRADVAGGTLCITIAAKIAQDGIHHCSTARLSRQRRRIRADRACHCRVRRPWLSFLQPSLEVKAPGPLRRTSTLRFSGGIKRFRTPTSRSRVRVRSLAIEADGALRSIERDAHAGLDALFASLQHRAFRGEL